MTGTYYIGMNTKTHEKPELETTLVFLLLKE